MILRNAIAASIAGAVVIAGLEAWSRWEAGQARAEAKIVLRPDGPRLRQVKFRPTEVELPDGRRLVLTPIAYGRVPLSGAPVLTPAEWSEYLALDPRPDMGEWLRDKRR